jgi:predicted transcriptional regulator
MNTKTKRLSKMKVIRTDQEQITQLERIGKEVDRPVSWLIRKAIAEFIERNKK